MYSVINIIAFMFVKHYGRVPLIALEISPPFQQSGLNFWRTVQFMRMWWETMQYELLLCLSSVTLFDGFYEGVLFKYSWK